MQHRDSMPSFWSIWSMAETIHIHHPFEPVYDRNSRVLILGSFPSVISRDVMFYYGNPQNRFWKVLSMVFDDHCGNTNDEKKAFCLKHHIALWDVIQECTITGSSDSSIKEVKVNDIAGLCNKTRISHIFTTGGKAASLYQRYVVCDVQMTPLPSTSGANARMHIEDLVQKYQEIRTYAEKN